MKLKTEQEVESLADAKHRQLNITRKVWTFKDGFAQGYTQAQQDLVASASEGFEEWVYKYPDKCDLRDFEKPNHNYFVAEEAWQAAKLSTLARIKTLKQRELGYQYDLREANEKMQEKDEEINFIKWVNSKLEWVRQSMLDVIDEKDAEIEKLEKKIKILEANHHFMEKEIRGE